MQRGRLTGQVPHIGTGSVLENRITLRRKSSELKKRTSSKSLAEESDPTAAAAWSRVSSVSGFKTPFTFSTYIVFVFIVIGDDQHVLVQVWVMEPNLC